MIYNLARFNCYNDTCRGSLIFPVGKWPIKIGLIYDQRCILIAATAAIVRLISLCAREKRKKKGRKKEKKRGNRNVKDWMKKKMITSWLPRERRVILQKSRVKLQNNFIFVCGIVFFFYLLSRDKISKISIFSKFNIRFFWSFMYRWSYDLIVKWEMKDRCERVEFQELFLFSFSLVKKVCNEIGKNWNIYIKC